MKKSIQTVFISVIILLNIACKSQQPVTDNQSVSSKEQTAVNTAPEAKPAAEAPKQDQTAQHASSNGNELVSGKEIVETSAKKLDSHLIMDSQQDSDLLRILTDAFVGSGESLEKLYPRATGKEMSSKLLKLASSSIKPILNDTQKPKFDKFLQQ